MVCGCSFGLVNYTRMLNGIRSPRTSLLLTLYVCVSIRMAFPRGKEVSASEGTASSRKSLHCMHKTPEAASTSEVAHGMQLFDIQSVLSTFVYILPVS